MSLDPARTALIIQDLQNDVISEGGAFADSGAPAHAASQNVVENVKGVAAAARAAGVPVIHVHYIVEAGAPGLKQNAPLFQGVKEANALVRGSWGAAPVDGLEPQEGDLVVEKTRMNGFYNTILDNLLRGFGTETLVITGAWTNMSIEHTGAPRRRRRLRGRRGQRRHLDRQRRMAERGAQLRAHERRSNRDGSGGDAGPAGLSRSRECVRP